MEALLAGMISHGAHSLYLVLLDRSDKMAGAVWASHRTLGEDLDRSERTVQRYMSELVEIGFVKVQHRYRLEAGQIVYVSSLKSFHIPAAVKARLEAQEDAARARRQRGQQRPPSRRGGHRRGSGAGAQRTTQSSAEIITQEQRRRQLAALAPCDPCGGQGWVERGDGVARCERCGGKGHSPP